MSVLLVRHSESAVDPSTPPHTWGLTDEGRARAVALDLGGRRLLAGPEPKLIETLAPHGTVEVDDRYRESHSEGWLGADAFLTAIERYFAGEEPAPGWERAADVVARFTLVDGAAICSGGRALAAVVTHHTGCDGLTLWRTLTMPHLLVLNRDDLGRWVASPARE